MLNGIRFGTVYYVMIPQGDNMEEDKVVKKETVTEQPVAGNPASAPVQKETVVVEQPTEVPARRAGSGVIIAAVIIILLILFLLLGGFNMFGGKSGGTTPAPTPTTQQ
jgi:hypothetical protein